jgi:hypothetical protein
MKAFSVLFAVAGLALALTSTSVYAARVIVTDDTPTTNNPDIPDIPVNPDPDPGSNPDPTPDPTPGGSTGPVAIVVPETPTPTPSSTPSDCADELGSLRVVRADRIQAVLDEKVMIQEVCADTSDLGSLFMRGNAGGLRNLIALNDTLAVKLAGEDFDASDVVGIRFGKHSVVLYVHKHN